MTRHVLAGTIALALCAAPPASADWLLTPFAGATFGGDSNTEHFSYGGTISYMGARVIGFEVEFGYTPNFFEPDDGDFGEVDFFDDSNVTTFMANLIVGVPIGQTAGIRPYVTGGGGLLRTSVTGADDLFDISSNDFGINVGAGLYIFASEHIGFRGDVRYFRSLQDSDAGDPIDLDLSDFDFWRATGGVTFRF